MFSRLGITDTLAAAIVAWLASAFGIFLVRQFFLSLPIPAQRTRRGGQARRLRCLQDVLQHRRAPGEPALATLAVFTLLGSWNDWCDPSPTSATTFYTLQVGLTTSRAPDVLSSSSSWPTVGVCPADAVTTPDATVSRHINRPLGAPDADGAGVRAACREGVVNGLSGTARE
jgi:ABC-type glycerol-3-phosphate transport system permease component